MSTAQLFWHLAKKDLRYLRWWLAAYFVALVPLTLPRWFIGDFKGSDNLPLTLAMFAMYVLFGVIQTLLVQVDARRDDGGFLISKPVSGSVLWAEKMLFWLALLVAPAVLSQVAQPLILGLEVDMREQAWSLLKWLTVAGVIYVSLLTLAMLTRNIAMLVALTVGIIVGFCFLSWLCNILLPRGFFDNGNRSVATDGSVEYVSGWWMITALTVTMLVWYCRRCWWPVAGGVVALAAGIFLLFKFWAWNFLPEWHGYEPPPANEQQRGEIAAFKVECVGKPRVELGKALMRGFVPHGKENELTQGFVCQDFHVTGLPEMWILRRMRENVDVTLASGEKLWGCHVPSNNDQLTEVELRWVLNGAELADTLPAPVFAYQREKLESLSDTKVTVSGTVTFQLRKVTLKSALALRAGETVVSKNERLEVLTVSKPDEYGAVRVRVLREKIGSRYPYDTYPRIWVNWPRKEIVSEVKPLRSSYGSAWNYHGCIEEYQCPRSAGERDALRLWFVRYECAEEIKVPVEALEVELER